RPQQRLAPDREFRSGANLHLARPPANSGLHPLLVSCLDVLGRVLSGYRVGLVFACAQVRLVAELFKAVLELFRRRRLGPVFSHDRSSPLGGIRPGVPVTFSRQTHRSPGHPGTADAGGRLAAAGAVVWTEVAIWDDSSHYRRFTSTEPFEYLAGDLSRYSGRSLL